MITIVIPMAGTGQRFVDMGYADPKPMISIEEPKQRKRVIDYVVQQFSPSEEYRKIIFIYNEEHMQKPMFPSFLHDIGGKNKEFVGMPSHKLGPGYTVKSAFDLIPDKDEVIIAYCDNSSPFDMDDFKKYVTEKKLDGCILTHTGFHPHTLSRKTKMAFLKLNGDDLVSEVKEKECYTDNPLNEHASTGIYYFRIGKMMKYYVQQTMEQNLNYNGEFYITLTYNLLIKDRLRVGYYDTKHAVVLGTPAEVKNFEAWSVILRGEQVQNEEEALRCYRYWKDYHKL